MGFKALIKMRSEVLICDEIYRKNRTMSFRSRKFLQKPVFERIKYNVLEGLQQVPS